MIKTPEIPTDNLYKFIALFGLVLSIFSSFTLYQNQIQFYAAIKTENKRIEKSTKDISDANTETLFLNDKIDFQKKLLFCKYGFKSDFNLNDTLMMKEKFLSDSFKKDYFFLKELEETEMKKNDLIERLDNKLNFDIDSKGVFLATFLMFVGVLLILFGFYKWYYKTQKLYDRQLLLSSINQNVFDEKLKTLIAFNTIYYKNKKYDAGVFEYNDYLEKIALDFDSYIAMIQDLEFNYSKYLSKEVNDELVKLKTIAIDGKQELGEDFEEVSEASSTLANKFDNVLNSLKNKIDDFYKDLL